MALPEDRFPLADVFSDTGDVSVGMKLRGDLQSVAAQPGVFQHHHAVIISRHLHASSHGKESLQKNRCGRPCALRVGGFYGKTVHGRPIKAGQADR